MKMTLGKAVYGENQGGESELVAFQWPTGQESVTHGGILAVLTDSVGGMASEREAARLALRQVLRDFAEVARSKSVPAALAYAVEGANHVVCTLARDNKEAGAVGVSLVMARVSGKELYWCSVGDARLYCLRHGELIQLTRDHTVARHLRLKVLQGALSLADIKGKPDRNALTSYLGMDPVPEVDANLRPFTLSDGDRLLLCSNGVHSVLDEERMAATLPTSDAQAAAKELVALAGSRLRDETDAIQTAVIGFPSPQRRAKFKGYSYSGLRKLHSQAVKSMHRIAGRMPRPIAGKGMSGISLAVAGLLIVTIVFVAVFLFLFLKEPSRQETACRDSLPATTSSQGDSTPTHQLQYRDLPLRRP
ncbi:MAG: protein phosphatase 2C domain-containing protein [Candidatus Thiosymbion ectosymbiont of Robbea hypermnestra]|nr:protein phosphatase 2C domain-containing protein [Candidatus Thiosymbion ectosymbiont of Robbea hypermnestra]